MTRMTVTKEATRAEVENALSAISTAGMLLDLQVRLRINQAIERDGRMAGLLGPSLQVLDRTDRAIDLAKATLSEIWHIGESQCWSSPVFTFPTGDEASSRKKQ